MRIVTVTFTGRRTEGLSHQSMLEGRNFNGRARNSQLIYEVPGVVVGNDDIRLRPKEILSEESPLRLKSKRCNSYKGVISLQISFKGELSNKDEGLRLTKEDGRY